MSRVWGALVLFFVAVLCSGAAAEQKVDRVDIRGSVTSAQAADAEARKKGLLGWVRVEGAKEKDTGYDKAAVRITDQTKIEKLVGTERKAAKFEDLKRGAKVQAAFIGPVAESYPVQTTAKEVLILAEGP